MSLTLWAQLVTIAVALISVMGLVFGMGRMAERLGNVERGQGKTDRKLDEIHEALFGDSDGDGVFLRRREWESALATLIREREAQDRRMTEQAERIGAIQEGLRR